jgi:hypothetical protein
MTDFADLLVGLLFRCNCTNGAFILHQSGMIDGGGFVVGLKDLKAMDANDCLEKKG